MIQCNTFGCFYGSKIEPYKIPEASYEITITISDIFEQMRFYMIRGRLKDNVEKSFKTTF